MIDYEAIEGYVRRSLYSYRTHDMMDDAVQEAMIRAWKDHEEGITEQSYLCRRAKIWAFNFLRDAPTGRRTATGAPKKSLEGRQDSRGQKTREKITQFLESYRELHEKDPKIYEVAEATGLSTAVVSYQWKNIREGKTKSNALYTDEYGERRIDYRAYSIGHFTTDNEDPIFGYLSKSDRHTESFEDDLLGDLDFNMLLGKVDEVHRKVLYLHHVLGYNAKEVAGALGYEKVSNVGSRRIKAAHEAVRAVVDPTFKLPEKRKYPVERKRVPKPKKPRPEQTHCSKGHEIRGWRKASQKRYCKICNNLRTNPGKTVDDIPADSKLWKWDERR